MANTDESARERALHRLARARSRKVMLATPSARAPVIDYTIAFAETYAHLLQSGIAFDARFVIGASNLPRARNELCARFLASDCTDLLFIDDDMGWSPTAIVRLLASERRVIGAVGRKRVDKPNSDPEVWCVRMPEGAARGLNQDEFGAIEVEGVGTGFLKIAREALEALAAAHPEWKRAGHDGMSEAVKARYFQFFRFGDEDDEGEDYRFCRRWRELGGRVWIDPAIALSHVGVKAYSGCIAEILVKGDDA